MLLEHEYWWRKYVINIRTYKSLTILLKVLFVYLSITIYVSVFFYKWINNVFMIYIIFSSYIYLVDPASSHTLV